MKDHIWEVLVVRPGSYSTSLPIPIPLASTQSYSWQAGEECMTVHGHMADRQVGNAGRHASICMLRHGRWVCHKTPVYLHFSINLSSIEGVEMRNDKGARNSTFDLTSSIWHWVKNLDVTFESSWPTFIAHKIRRTTWTEQWYILEGLASLHLTNILGCGQEANGQLCAGLLRLPFLISLSECQAVWTFQFWLFSSFTPDLPTPLVLAWLLLLWLISLGSTSWQPEFLCQLLQP